MGKAGIRRALAAGGLSWALLFGLSAGSAGAIVPNDPQFPNQYAPGRISAPAAWDVTTGSSQVKVAVVDDGVNPAHVDLAPNLDLAAGHDFGEGDNNATEQDSGHGSQVASILGSRGNNAFGMAGLAWNVRIIPVKVRKAGAGSRGAQITAAAEAAGFQYAGAIGARVANASFSNGPDGASGRSVAQQQAIVSRINAAPNTLFVFSAANSGSNNDIFPRFPCNYGAPPYNAPNVICVGGSNEGDGLWSLSNYGANSVDLVAPAENILTTNFSAGHPNEYVRNANDGTSYAAPMVSGVAALYFARYPNATVADARRAILAGVDVKPDLQGKTVTGGRLNAQRTLAIAPGTALPPPRLTGLTLRPSRFRARRGTRVRFSLSQPAWVTFRVQKAARGRRAGRRCARPRRSNRRRRRCTRWVTLRGSFIRAGKPGRNSFKFRGRLRGHRLRRGRYRLRARATNVAKSRSVPKTKGFRIIR
jgi:subtilisin family serine protease